MGVHGGKGVLVESSKKVKPWRDSVSWAAQEAITQKGLIGVAIPGPVAYRMAFTLAKPKSAKKKNAVPDKKPDISKLIRATEDALTDAGMWEDDARVVYMSAAKFYVGDSHPEALPTPGAIITAWSVADDEAVAVQAGLKALQQQAKKEPPPASRP
jgi:crossover junction endodeoxyribonuclease RusA